MIATLRFPFPCLSADQFISRGAAGHVFAVSQHLVLKCPTVFDNPHPRQEEEMHESKAQIEREKAMYEILMEHRHPHIVHAVLCVPQGIFMHRLAMTLDSRLDQQPIPESLKGRWITQLVSAVSWLEHLGFVHGDLRPGNVLLTLDEDVKLGDFDCSVRLGKRLLAGGGAYGKLEGNFDLPLASPVTEQFALGSCIFTIQLGHEPWHEVDEHERVLRFLRSEFPDTSSDKVVGGVVRKCWHGEYDSICAVERDVLQRLGLEDLGCDGRELDEEFVAVLRGECEAFLENNASRDLDRADDVSS